MRRFKKKFKQFISYLCTNYLNENCRFPHSWWNYHGSLSQSDFCLTTNSLENLNGRLKTKVGVGYLSRAKAYKKLKEFHVEYISKYTAQVTKNRMPLIRKKYLDREKKLKELLNEFHDLTFEDQMSKLEFYCTQFGLYTSDKEASDFGKVPEPSLSEIQEFQSASFLSFREVLNY